MSEWERVFLLWPRKVDGCWRWLCHVECRWVPAGCSLYGDFYPEYRAEVA